MSTKVVQERLGHSTIMLTMDTYSHVLEGMQEAATEAMDSALGASRFRIESGYIGRDGGRPTLPSRPCKQP